jgi:hypothetical protein
VKSAVVLLVLIGCIVCGHELAHGLVTLALGGAFPFMQMTPTGARSITLFPLDFPPWRQGAVLLAGYGAQLLLCVFLLPLTRATSAPEKLRWAAAYVGALTAALALVGSGLLEPWLPSAGEAGVGLRMLGLPAGAQVAVKTVWLIAQLGLGVFFLRWLIVRARAARPLWTAIGRAHPEGSGWAYAAVAVAAILIQLFVFGPDAQHPRGLFLTADPPEINIAACNVHLRFEPSGRVRVQVLMRPFVSQHRFLWDRVRNSEPKRWQAYDDFVLGGVPHLVPAAACRIVRHRADRSARFYVDGRWEAGARVVEAEADLSAWGPDPERTIRIVDFWRKQGIGYFDAVEAEMGGALTIGRLRVAPPDSRSPALVSERLVRWENPDFQGSFEESYLTLVSRP